MTKYDDRLTAELRARAEDTGGHPISLADVKTKATSIRRRRNGLAATAVAGVLAVAVSVGATAIRANTDAGNLPPTQETTDTQPDTVNETHHVVLTTDVADRGDGVLVPYLQDGTIHLSDSAPVHIEDSYGAGDFIFHDQY